MNSVVTLLEGGATEFATATQESAQEIQAILEQLQKVVGDPNDTSVPEDPKPVIQEFARTLNRLAQRLVEEKDRVDAFVKEHPALAKHPRWTMPGQQLVIVNNQMQMARVTLPSLLTQSIQGLTNISQELRQVLGGQYPLDQLQGVVRDLRQIAVQRAQHIEQDWLDRIKAILEDGKNIDPESRQFLAANGGGELFKEQTEQLTAINTQIDGLPKIELDAMASKLQEENIIVVETKTDARVIPFDDVWVPSESSASRMGAEEAERRRVFVGDSAISDAVLSLQSEKPIATIILTGFEPQGIRSRNASMSFCVFIACSHLRSR
jgi:hypothetical protein